VQKNRYQQDPEIVSQRSAEAELKQLRKENEQLRRERDILKKKRVFRQGVAAQYALINQWRLVFPVQVMCRVLSASRSGFYYWLG